MLAVIAALFIWTLRSPIGGMVTYWWFSIFRPQDWIYIDITSMRLPLIATVLFFLGSLFRKHLPKINDPISIFMVLFFILGTISNTIVGCNDLFKVIDPIEYLGLLLVATLITIDIVDTKKKLLILIVTVALSLGFYSGKGGLVAMLSGGASNYGAANLGGTFTGSNAFAMGTATILFFLIFLYQQLNNNKTLECLPALITRHRTFIKLSLFLMILGSVFNIISLFSRGSAIAVFVGFCIFFLFRQKKFKKFIILIPVAVLAISTIPIPEGYKDRISSAFADSNELDDSAASRPFFWKVAREMVADNPLGVGPGCYRSYYLVYAGGNTQYGYARDVHSSHFQAMADSGYLGVAVWVLLFILSYKRLFNILKLSRKEEQRLENPLFYIQISQMLIISQTIFLIGGSFYTLTYSDLIWLIWGIVIVVSKLMNKEIKDKKEVNPNTVI